jgi:hypothetical protein
MNLSISIISMLDPTSIATFHQLIGTTSPPNQRPPFNEQRIMIDTV